MLSPVQAFLIGKPLISSSQRARCGFPARAADCAPRSQLTSTKARVCSRVRGRSASSPAFVLSTVSSPIIRNRRTGGSGTIQIETGRSVHLLCSSTNVCVGSIALVWRSASHFRCTPDSGLGAASHQVKRWATSGDHARAEICPANSSEPIYGWTMRSLATGQKRPSRVRVTRRFSVFTHNRFGRRRLRSSGQDGESQPRVPPGCAVLSANSQ